LRAYVEIEKTSVWDIYFILKEQISRTDVLAIVQWEPKKEQYSDWLTKNASCY